MKGQESAAAMVVAVMFVLLLASFFIFGVPLLQPWWAEQTGKAELAQAEQNRQIAITEAKAKKESSVLLAEAEVERSRGVAKANEIISASISENYLRYLWIQGLQTNQMQVVYVPTEANLPILEAGRLK